IVKETALMRRITFICIANHLSNNGNNNNEIKNPFFPNSL
ncbi:unnamed protein product, partial [Rotaria sp. Silwood2]